MTTEKSLIKNKEFVNRIFHKLFIFDLNTDR